MYCNLSRKYVVRENINSFQNRLVWLTIGYFVK